MEAVRLEDLGAFARKVLEQLSLTSVRDDKATVVALSGDLGAGKTTFTQALARELGVTDIVQSPTYVLMKNYDISKNTLVPFSKLVHIDAYRLDAPEQFAALRPEQFLNDPRALVVVEWPERLAGALPKPDLTIQFSSHLPDNPAGDAGEGERYIGVV